MKIAISSDNHLDVNRVDVAATMEAQAAWLKQQEVAHYFSWGIYLTTSPGPSPTLKN